ncbi:hypothetical protein QFZ80_002837 [Paenibacillus sp. V4I7]|nr:hypothetical protein [Paenibacillus sp. V4I7]MDQ0915005.1 hypothetical protein [Paenibacillus sp. V4I5]
MEQTGRASGIDPEERLKGKVSGGNAKHRHQGKEKKIIPLRVIDLFSDYFYMELWHEHVTITITSNYC